jgi:ABC-2 type transport system permease protein
MIRLLMRAVPQGSFAWLTLHEIRLSWASRSRRKLGMVIGLVMLAVWLAGGIWVGWLLRDTPLHLGPERMAQALTGALAASIMIFTFMTTQSILASQRTLFEAGDLDLLFTAPVPPRNVMRAKLVGIAAAVALSFAMLILPLTLPAAILGHPELFGIPALLLALALSASCFGLAITLLLARIAGPRAARTVGQIAAALSGGAIFLLSQLWNTGDHGSRGGMAVLFKKMMDSGFGTHGLAALPGMAAFGDPYAVTALLAGSILLFIGTTAATQALFLNSYRAGGMKLSRTKRAKGSIARYFHDGLFGSIYAKEWRLLARDPALAFQIVLRLVYLAPILLVAIRNGRHIPVAPAMAFSSVLIAGQVVSSFVWLAVSAEDTPDLLKVAPVRKHEIDRAKLTTAMAMAAPLALLLPIGIAFWTIPGALVTLAVTGLAGWMTGLVEVTFAKPAPRASFRNRRGGGSFLRGLFAFGLTLVLGGVASLAVYFLDPLSQTVLPDWSKAASVLNVSSPRY